MSQSEDEYDSEVEREAEQLVQASPPLQDDPEFEQQMAADQEAHLDAPQQPPVGGVTRSRAEAPELMAALRERTGATLQARAQQLVDNLGHGHAAREYVSLDTPEAWRQRGVGDVYVHLFGARARAGNGFFRARARARPRSPAA